MWAAEGNAGPACPLSSCRRPRWSHHRPGAPSLRALQNSAPTPRPVYQSIPAGGVAIYPVSCGGGETGVTNVAPLYDSATSRCGGEDTQPGIPARFAHCCARHGEPRAGIIRSGRGVGPRPVRRAGVSRETESGGVWGLLERGGVRRCVTVRGIPCRARWLTAVWCTSDGVSRYPESRGPVFHVKHHRTVPFAIGSSGSARPDRLVRTGSSCRIAQHLVSRETSNRAVPVRHPSHSAPPTRGRILYGRATTALRGLTCASLGRHAGEHCGARESGAVGSGRGEARLCGALGGDSASELAFAGESVGETIRTLVEGREGAAEPNAATRCETGASVDDRVGGGRSPGQR